MRDVHTPEQLRHELPLEHEFLEGRYDGKPRWYCKWCGLPQDKLKKLGQEGE